MGARFAKSQVAKEERDKLEFIIHYKTMILENMEKRHYNGNVMSVDTLNQINVARDLIYGYQMILDSQNSIQIHWALERHESTGCSHT